MVVWGSRQFGLRAYTPRTLSYTLHAHGTHYHIAGLTTLHLWKTLAESQESIESSVRELE